MARVPVVLSIAGSDSGGGAGIQADLAAFRDHRALGTTAITAVTAQHTRGVTRVDPVPVAGVVAQIEAVRSDLRVDAIKIGMLGHAACVEAVADALARWPDRPPVVLDPVMVATSGDRLLEPDAVAAIVARLLPLADLVTPNLPEAAILAGATADLGAAIRARGAQAVLVTGGDADGDVVFDVLTAAHGARTWSLPRIAGGPFHGTGCTLSSAIAARLAHGVGLEDAVDGAIAYVRGRLETAFAPGSGARVPGLVPGQGVMP